MDVAQRVSVVKPDWTKNLGDVGIDVKAILKLMLKECDVGMLLPVTEKAI
jgi:hypothetical protein